MDIIWHDSEAMNGRGMPTEYAGLDEINLGPTSKRETPCGGCERAPVCMVEAVECAAFRKWCDKGDYDDKQVGIKLKAI